MARVLISMKDDFLKRIDDLAEEEQRSRSELIREALRLYLRENQSELPLPQRRRVRQQENETSENQIITALLNDVTPDGLNGNQ